MSIRDPNSSESPQYDTDDKYLSMRLYHGGTLIWIPRTEYIGGALTNYDYFDTDTISYDNLFLKVRALGHGGQMNLFYRLPDKSLETGLVLIKGDGDVEKMKSFGKKNNQRIDVYVDHCREEQLDIEHAYENICPDDYDKHDSNGVGYYSDDLDDHDFVDSDYSMSEEGDKMFYANVDEGVEWAGRIRDGLGLENDDDDREDSVGSDDSQSDDFNSIPDIDIENDHVKRKKKHEFPYYEDSEDPSFEVGMIFKDHYELRAAITKHSYKQGRMVNFEKSDRTRVKAVCKAQCPWFIFASVNWEKSFQIKKLGPAHTCVREQTGLPLIHSGFLAAKYLNDFRMNPQWSIAAFHKKVIQDLQIDFKYHVLRRARHLCLKKINGVDGEHYAKLWDYKTELLRKNPHSTVELEFEQGSPGVFRRMYVCLGGIKHGFKLGCRKVLGLDGTHIKNHFKGQLLCAVGVDPNNCMFPICYAVVEAENQDSWEWFVKLFIDDFDMDQGQGWVVISDRQKGLINVVDNLLPRAEQRFCVRHMHNNFKQKYKGRSLKDKMWACARAPNVEAFNKAMEIIKTESLGAFEWLNAVPKQHWTRSHFRTEVKCDILLNNMCESFNRSILFPREQGILVMLEMIRDYLMQRLQTKRANSWDWDENTYTPKIMKLVEKYKKWSGGCYAAYAGYNQFEVTTVNGSKFAVDLNTYTCGCRRWDISGIPCHHAIASIKKLGARVEDYIDGCYTVRTYKKCYSGLIYPMNGEEHWEKTGYTIKPPNIKKQPGRPKRKRKQDPFEGPLAYEKSGVKILTRRNQISIRCGMCNIVGHNKKSCPKKAETDGASTTNQNNGSNEAEMAGGRGSNGAEMNSAIGGNEGPSGGNEGPIGGNEGPSCDNENVVNEPYVADEAERHEVHNDCVMEMYMSDDAPRITQPTQEEPQNLSDERVCNIETEKEISRKKGKQKIQEEVNINEEEETWLEINCRKIQELKKKWAAEAKAKEEAKTKEKAKQQLFDETAFELPVRRSGRLNKPKPIELQFSNTPETALVVEDDNDNAGNQNKKQKKMVKKAPWNNNFNKTIEPPQTYTGPSLVGQSKRPPVKQFKTKVGGVNVNAKGFIKNGKAVVTREALAAALDNAKKNLQKHDKSCDKPDKESGK